MPIFNSSFSPAGATEVQKKEIVDWCSPNYDATITVSAVSQYIAPTNGILYIIQNTGNFQLAISVNGILVLRTQGHSGSSHGQPASSSTLIVHTGDVVTFSSTGFTGKFIPLRG